MSNSFVKFIRVRYFCPMGGWVPWSEELDEDFDTFSLLNHMMWVEFGMTVLGGQRWQQVVVSDSGGGGNKQRGQSGSVGEGYRRVVEVWVCSDDGDLSVIGIWVCSNSGGKRRATSDKETIGLGLGQTAVVMAVVVVYGGGERGEYQMKELSLGLEASGARYLWIVRADQESSLKAKCCSEQIHNSKIIVEDLGVGEKLKRVVGLENVIGREEIAEILVMRFMDLNAKESKEMRRRAKELQETCHKAIDTAG
ncbi:hypothetical protein Vadar_011670 [Vaccinium darrowii]|uniref:Uncharacterized protein n=1 Tax=Vaccinium darrowii TaxID=229202 RepID=A0ACB7YN33_9ERIC|nr:hypothetical protein Vadar_011670 [Vaccinium darrowii]